MCTVSFIPLTDKVIVTSNRDVQRERLPAKEPAVHRVGGARVFFPKDTQAGGTWFAIHERGTAVVLLNGGWKNHEYKPPYRKSRGLILLDLLAEESVVDAFEAVNLRHIESFTLVIWEEEKLNECRWDGTQKYSQQKDAARPHIWSSVTLYDENIAARRVQWFVDWLSKYPDPSQQQVLDFHRFTGDGDRQNDLLMNRDGIVSTASITSASISRHVADVCYLDVHVGQSWEQEFTFSQAIAGKA